MTQAEPEDTLPEPGSAAAGPEAPYELKVSGSVSRVIAERLPETVAWAVIDFITGRLLTNPRRVGHPLHNELTGSYGAHVGDYRVCYDVDDEGCVVEVFRVARRADVYGLG
jgi:mRNA interferase RelE/StbE